MLGSLSALNALESDASERRKREAEFRSRRHAHQRLSQRIERLKQRRADLLQKLHDQADSESSSSNEKQRDTAETGDESDELRSALTYVTELREKLEVYKMTGVSMVQTDQDTKLLCFTTSCPEGVYLESYHLKLLRLPSGKYKVTHHDLPPFIVYATLPGDLEVKDVTSAVRPVQEALSMFVVRREEMKAAQAKFADGLRVSDCSAAVDYLCCHLDIGADVQVQITLKYADLSHDLPSSVKAVLLRGADGRKTAESLPQPIMDSLHSFFFTHRLCVALSQTAQLLPTYLQT